LQKVVLGGHSGFQKWAEVIDNLWLDDRELSVWGSLVEWESKFQVGFNTEFG
jgi:hypothetical protein